MDDWFHTDPEPQQQPRRPRRAGRMAAVAGIFAAGLLAGGMVSVTLPAAADGTTSDSTTSDSSASDSTTSDSTGKDCGGRHGHGGQRPDETPLTGDDAAQATAAAEAAVPGATVDRVETDADGGTYEAHMTTSDGARVTVLMDADFTVTEVLEGMGRGPQRPADDSTDADATAWTAA